MQDLDKFKNEMNLSGKNVYVGHRYVPKIMGDWDNTQIYEPLSIVQYQGNSFTSRQFVPSGVELTNEEYWASTGNYNTQVEYYRQDVMNLGKDVNNINDEVITARDGEVTLNDRLDNDKQEVNTKLTQRQTYVTYEDFGAIGDGVTDDGMAILNAHVYANQNNLTVKTKKGAYYLGTTHSIPVKTNVDWNGSTIIVDENKNSNAPSFIIESKHDVIEIAPENLLTKINSQTKTISELKEYGNVFIVLENANHRTYHRLGYGSSQAQTDFTVLNYGEVVHDFVEDFTEFTSVKIYPIDDDVLNIKNATFKSLTTNQAVNVRKGIVVKRSRTHLENINHLLDTKTDKGISTGFYVFERTAYSKLTNSSVTSRAVGGSYDILLHTTICLELNGVDSKVINSGDWGVIGSNYVKDIIVKNCKLNRFDAHSMFFGNNLIENCIIGTHGILLNGGGLLKIIDTTIEATHAIKLRDDYGASWNGDLIIKRLTHKPKEDTNQSRLFFINHFNNHDFGYDSVFGKTKTVVEDYKLITNVKNFRFPLIQVNSIQHPSPERPITNAPYYLGDNFEFKGITNSQQSNGFLLFNGTIADMRSYKDHSYKIIKESHIGSRLIDIKPNIEFTLDNVQFIEQSDSLGSLLGASTFLGGNASDDYLSITNRLIPKFTIKNSDFVRANVYGLPSIVNVENCFVNSLNGNGTGVRSMYSITNSKIKPIGTGFMIRVNEMGSMFTSCVFLKPVVNGVEIDATMENFGMAYQNLSGINSTNENIRVHGNYANCLFEDMKLEEKSGNRFNFDDIGDSKYYMIRSS